MKPQWVAIHVYYRADQDSLLLDGVLPVLNGLVSAGDVTQFFFLRYWQGGLHIRLRFRCMPGSCDRVRDVVQKALDRYLAARPSVQPVDLAGHAAALARLGDLEGRVGDPFLVPDNSVLFSPYEPEFGKYGGLDGVEIAEEVFDCSSAAAFVTLGWCRARPGARLGHAYAMMLQAMHAAHLCGQDAAYFLARYCRTWLPYVPYKVASGWERLNAEPLVLGQYPAPLHGGDSQVERLAGRWAHAVGTALDPAASRLPAVLNRVIGAGPQAPAEERRLYLLLNYIHTHNNRLGVTPPREAYLAFLGHRALCARFGLRLEPVLEYDHATTCKAEHEYH